MQSIPLVSVLMTAYNREKYIAEAIESVLANTYTNFELIIVDDCSTDKTTEIAHKYESIDQRVHVYKNETNMGDYPNRNKAASYAKGKYIKYVDADDYIYPYCLEVLIYSMEKFPQAAFGQMSLKQNNLGPFPILLNPYEIFKFNYFDNVNLFGRSPLASIYLKSTFDELGGFSGKRQVGDFELNIKFANKNSLLLLHEGLAWYRVHEESESAKNKSWYFAIEYLKIELENLLSKECPLLKTEKTLIIKKTSHRILRIFVSMLIRLKFHELLYNFKRVKNILKIF
jgi:glycosyltransferase involved in cell wall biosynthesis